MYLHVLHLLHLCNVIASVWPMVKNKLANVKSNNSSMASLLGALVKVYNSSYCHMKAFIQVTKYLEYGR